VSEAEDKPAAAAALRFTWQCVRSGDDDDDDASPLSLLLSSLSLSVAMRDEGEAVEVEVEVGEQVELSSPAREVSAVATEENMWWLRLFISLPWHGASQSSHTELTDGSKVLNAMYLNKGWYGRIKKVRR
jgi:hypothetical protein